MDLCFENRYEFFLISDAEMLRGVSKASRWFCMCDVSTRWRFIFKKWLIECSSKWFLIAEQSLQVSPKT